MTDNLAEKSPTKRVYRSPELRVYGDINRITQTLQMISQNEDTIHGKNLKTV